MPDRLDRFEAGAGRLTREVVENATAPVRDAALVLIDAAFGWLSRFTLGVLFKVIAALAAAIFMVIAIGCGCTAAYLALAAVVGPIVAWLVVALLFLVLAAVMAVVAVQTRMEPRPSQDTTVVLASAAAAGVSVANEAGLNAPDAAPDDDANLPDPEPGLRGSAQALATVLGAAGLPRQQAGVQAGLVLADRLTPWQLAIVGAAAAFAGGRELKIRRTNDPQAGPGSKS